MTWKETQEFFKGKLILIGINFIEKNDELVESYQTHGRVKELTNDSLFIIDRKDNVSIQMPYDLESIVEAEKGDYSERTSGEIIKDPDFIMTWDIFVDNNDDLEEIKKYGYIQ